MREQKPHSNSGRSTLKLARGARGGMDRAAPVPPRTPTPEGEDARRSAAERALLWNAIKR